jgi:hypothetical protein
MRVSAVSLLSSFLCQKRTRSNTQNIGPRRGQERPPGARRPVVGLADLRRDTPCPPGTPTGAGATASPRLGPGLRAPARRERQPKPRALSGRGGRLCAGFPTLEKTGQQRGGGQGSRASPEAAARPEGGTGRGLGAKPEPLTLEQPRTCSVVGGGVAFHPAPCHAASAPGGPAGGGLGVAFDLPRRGRTTISAG